jgi:membrane protease YdiL (CAAX protease family)
MSPEFFSILWAGSFGPTVGAIGGAWLTGGYNQVKVLLGTIFLFRTGWQIYVAMLFGFPLVFFMGYIALEITPLTGILLMAATLVVAAPINGLMTALMGPGPLGEELGWRGYALPRLLNYFSPAQASIVVGIAWAVWHAPLFVFPDWRNDVSIGWFTLLYPLSIIALSFAFTAVYLRSNGSVGLAMIFHGVINFTAGTASNPQLWEFDGYSNLGRFTLVVGLMSVAAAAIWFFLLSNRSKRGIF